MNARYTAIKKPENPPGLSGFFEGIRLLNRMLTG
jgi:hypothetical protein